MSRDVLLAIDLGTQSVRALLFDLQGTLLAKARVPLDDYTTPQPGWHEHDVEGFWTALCRASNLLWHENTALRDRVAGLALTTQRGTVVALDGDGRPLRPAITWLDQRKSPSVPPLPARWKAAFAIARVSDTIAYLQREAEANWINACEPEIWARTAKYMLISGYLLHRLTGRYIDSIGSQVGYLPFDYKLRAWAPAKSWRWDVMPVAPHMLPELVEPGTVIGEITSEASEATGIPRDLPIVAGASDKACEVLGAGCLEPHCGALSYGTTATINTVSRRYFESTPLMPPYPAAIPGAFTTEVQVFRGYWMVTWFMEQFGATADILDSLLESVPPGSMGLMTQPYWTPGFRMPEAKGAVIGFGDVHSRAHFYRSILEGLAFALREGKERIERKSRIAITSLRVAGGGSQSDAAMQLTADVFGIPASRPHVYETSGLGAAMDAAVGLGLHPDFATAVREMTRTARTFEPQPETRRIYDALYERVYLKMYDRLRPLYADIREITGYPPD